MCSQWDVRGVTIAELPSLWYLRQDAMRTNSNQPDDPNPSDKANGAKRKGLLVLIVVVTGVSLAFWLRSGTASHPAEPTPSTSAQTGLQPRPADHSATGNWPSAQGFSPATAAGKRPLEDLRAAFLAAEALESTMEQDAALKRCMEGLAPEMAANLLAILKPEELKSGGAGRLFDYWATANPKDAAAWAQGQGDVETRQSFLNVAALRWAVTDLKEATTWARSLPAGDTKTEIMAAVGSEAVRSDPFEALRLGFELPAGAAKTNLLRRAASEWAVKDRDSAVQWAQQIEDKDLRQLVTEQVAVASAEQDPVGAATIAMQQMVPGTEQDRAVVSIIQRWVQTNPEHAAAWVREFPQCQLGRDAMDNLVNLWTDKDLVASGDWLLTLPAGELRNVGILAYSRALERTDAEFARKVALPANRVP